MTEVSRIGCRVQVHHTAAFASARMILVNLILHEK
jgi:hypothetical protein